MGFIITICRNCNSFLKEGEATYPITINLGGGLVEQKEVCATCYDILDQQNESKLLLENA